MNMLHFSSQYHSIVYRFATQNTSMKHNSSSTVPQKCLCVSVWCDTLQYQAVQLGTIILYNDTVLLPTTPTAITTQFNKHGLLLPL